MARRHSTQRDEVSGLADSRSEGRAILDERAASHGARQHRSSDRVPPTGQAARQPDDGRHRDLIAYTRPDLAPTTAAALQRELADGRPAKLRAVRVLILEPHRTFDI